MKIYVEMGYTPFISFDSEETYTLMKNLFSSYGEQDVLWATNEISVCVTDDFLETIKPTIKLLNIEIVKIKSFRAGSWRRHLEDMAIKYYIIPRQ